MLKPAVNNYSWYVISKHGWVDSPDLYRVDLDKDVQVRLNTKNRYKVVVVRSKYINSDIESKKHKQSELINMLHSIEGGKVHVIEELSRLRDKIISEVSNA